MTRAEAAAWKYAKAGQRSLDEAAVLRCANRGEGCVVVPHDTWPKPAPAVEMPGHAAECSPCSKHQPSKRFAWLHDVAVEDVIDYFGDTPHAVDVNGLRKYLPKRHMEYRR